MKASIYCRVSSDKQEQEGSSLDTQLEGCLKKAQELGYEIPQERIIQETWSGLNLDRPKLNQLREWIRNKEIDAVIAYAYDRFSRDPSHLVILRTEMEKVGVQLVLVTEEVDTSEMGKLIGYIKGFAGKLEAEKIKERTSRGRKARIASGKLSHGQASYLYAYNYVPSTKAKLEGEGVRQVDEEQAQVVRDIFKSFTEDYLTIGGICHHLRDLGIASPTGNPVWGRSTIHAMLTNPAYLGDQFTPALIDQVTYDKAQLRLKRNKELSARNVKRDYLLRGYAHCGHCGSLYQGVAKKYQDTEYLYYRCSSSFKVNITPCPNHSWKAQELDAIVWQEIETALSNPDVIMAGLESLQQEAASAGETAGRLAEIDQRLKGLDKEQRQLFDNAMRGFPEELIESENKRINESRNAILSRRAETSARLKTAEQAEVDATSIQEALSVLKGNLKTLSLEERRFTLEALNIRILVSDSQVSIEGALPFVSSPSIRGEYKTPNIIPFNLEAVKVGV